MGVFSEDFEETPRRLCFECEGTKRLLGVACLVLFLANGGAIVLENAKSRSRIRRLCEVGEMGGGDTIVL